MRQLSTNYVLSLLICLALVGIIHFPIVAQEFETGLDKGSTLRLEHIHGSIKIEEYKGKKLLVKAPTFAIPEKAKGMKLLSAIEDNTGLGLNQRKEGNTLLLTGVYSREYEYLLQVPKGITIEATLHDVDADRLEITNFTGALRIEVTHTQVILHNISGPLAIDAAFKTPEIIFAKEINQTKPSTIHCVHGDVEISLSKDAKVTVETSSNSGDVYTDMDIKLQKTDDTSHILGKLNGGGVLLQLSSSFGDIYIRKDKE